MKDQHMKMGIGAFVAILLWISSAVASDSQEERVAAARELMDYMNVEASFRTITEQITEQMFERYMLENSEVPTEQAQMYRNELQAAMIDESMVFVEDYIEIMSKHLSTEEIRELIRFYKSPLGKGIMEKLPLINQERATNAISKASEIAARATAHADEKMREAGYPW